jgi:hypothetical protein
MMSAAAATMSFGVEAMATPTCEQTSTEGTSRHARYAQRILHSGCCDLQLHNNSCALMQQQVSFVHIACSPALLLAQAHH